MLKEYGGRLELNIIEVLNRKYEYLGERECTWLPWSELELVEVEDLMD